MQAKESAGHTQGLPSFFIRSHPGKGLALSIQGRSSAILVSRDYMARWPEGSGIRLITGWSGFDSQAGHQSPKGDRLLEYISDTP